MRSDRAKYFVIIMTALGGICAGLTLMLLTRPTLMEANDLAVKLTEAETEVQAQYANRKQLGETIDRIAVAKKTVMRLAAQFVRQGEELSFITAIEGIGDSNKVETKLQLGSGGGGLSDAKEFDKGFTLTIDGPFTSVMHAIVDLERLKQMTVIQSFTIRGQNAPIGTDAPVEVLLMGIFASPPSHI